MKPPGLIHSFLGVGAGSGGGGGGSGGGGGGGGGGFINLEHYLEIEAALRLKLVNGRRGSLSLSLTISSGPNCASLGPRPGRARLATSW